ncbi:MAG: IMP dehydrogenase [Neisseriaceae bacterium]
MDILQKAYTFDDVLLVPGSSSVLPKEVQLKTRICRDVHLNVPLVSAAMDTVTEAKLAISMAQEGGIGIIHKNMSNALQARCIQKVKRHESGVVKDPVTVSPHLSIKDVIELSRRHKISSLPVVENGELVGLVTNRDLRFEDRMDIPISQLMTPRDRLVTVKEGTSIEAAKALMHRHKIERVLLTDDNWALKGLITVRDILKTSAFPNANKDSQGRLRVGAAIGVSEGTEERVAGLVREGVDVVVVDTAHGHHESILKMVQTLKASYRDLPIVAGNIATAQAAQDLVKAGVDGVKVGIGPGSICTTRIIAGVGVPQLTAISNVFTALKDCDIPIIADGGIRYSGDIAKALAAGADCVMLGGMFAGTDEAPGEIELYQGRSYKSYRGMGSLAAMAKGSAERYFQGNENTEKLVPEGIEGRVPYKGPVINIIHQLLGGLRSSMGYIGCASIEEMHRKAKFVEITAAGITESHVHDVQITKEAPNYQVR